jgi:hypothetical protein
VMRSIDAAGEAGEFDLAVVGYAEARKVGWTP